MSQTLTRARSLATIVERVAGERAPLIDPLEGTALIESFGYTDARVQEEFGFPDTLTLGTHVFEMLSRTSASEAIVVEEAFPPRFITALNSFASSAIYAVPWLAAFIVECVRSDLLQLPRGAGPPLSIALMFSLIVSGGFVQAIRRRGQFYIGLRQPGLASLIVGYLFRVGATAVVATALAGLAVGWYFELFAWPYLVLAADQLIILALLWMACGILTVREEHWRVPAAFAAGAALFIVMRAADRDALIAVLVAAGAVLVAAFAQVPSVFQVSAASDTPSPRMTVLLYRLLPYLWYGTAYFCFLFADRLTASASVAALSGQPFGMRRDYKLGMDLALLSFLFGSAVVEYANVRFTQLLRDLARGRPDSFRPSVARLHRRMLGLVVVGYVPIALTVAFVAMRFLPAQPSSVWLTVAIGGAGYLLFAMGLLNALVLFTLNDPWTAVRALTGALVVNVVVGAVMSHALNTYFAAAGLMTGAVSVAMYSTNGVSRLTHRVDHAIASF